MSKRKSNKTPAVLFLITVIVILFTLTGCSGYEISTKLVSDAIVITPEKLRLVTDAGDKPKTYEVDYVKLNTSLKDIKNKYDLNPFLSHSKEIIISADVTVKQLASLIQDLKENNQIPPDAKVSLAEKEALDMLENGDVTTEEIHTIIKNSGICDERICSYNSYLTGDKFTMLYENGGELKIKQITI